MTSSWSVRASTNNTIYNKNVDKQKITPVDKGVDIFFSLSIEMRHFNDSGLISPNNPLFVPP
jgi:hypothetical protein